MSGEWSLFYYVCIYVQYYTVYTHTIPVCTWLQLCIRIILILCNIKCIYSTLYNNINYT